MNLSQLVKIIKNLASAEQIVFKKHCIVRMNERGIKTEYIKESLLNAEII